jgi:mannosyltransferase OCH1-like enzyme
MKMIPKKIHYCWFGGGLLPEDLQRYIKTWQEIMPDYQIKVWDESQFDCNSIAFVKEAYSIKKWAFVADYVRLFALYSEGGIYLDTDVMVKKRFDDLLNNRFISSIECHKDTMIEQNASQYLTPDGTSKKSFTPIPGIGIQSAFIGSIPQHPLLKECMDYYKDRHFILENGSFFNKIIAPTILSMNAEKYGFKYIDKDQDLSEGIHVYKSDFFASKPSAESNESYAVHFCVGSWKEKERVSVSRKIYLKIKAILKK